MLDKPKRHHDLPADASKLVVGLHTHARQDPMGVTSHAPKAAADSLAHNGQQAGGTAAEGKQEGREGASQAPGSLATATAAASGKNKAKPASAAAAGAPVDAGAAAAASTPAEEVPAKSGDQKEESADKREGGSSKEAEVGGRRLAAVRDRGRWAHSRHAAHANAAAA